MASARQVTVFGGTGFIGRYVVQRLAKQGAIVRVPTRDREKALVLKPSGNVGQIVPIACSAHSDQSVAHAIGNSDSVINLVGILYEKGRDSFQSVHVEAAARIARIAREQGAKNFAHLSALGADSASSSRYARSKAAGELAVRMFFPDAVIFRPSIVFGPEDNFFNLFASLARFSPALPLFGGGATKFQPVYAGNVADAVVETLSQPKTRGQNYELGGPQIYSFRQLIEIILRETGKRRLLIDIPWAMATLQAAFLELLPHPLLTRDQIKLLRTDNIIRDASAKTLHDLGVTPTALEIILPVYLNRFRTGGDLRAATQAAASTLR